MNSSIIPISNKLFLILCLQQYCVIAHSINENNNKRQFPLILGWNDFFDTGNVIHTIAPKEQTNECSNRRCIYSDNKKESQNASIIIFHGNSVNFKAPFPENRRPDQLYVFFSMETPYSAFGIEFPMPNFFNLSITYRIENELNLHAPYGSFWPANFSNNEDLNDMWEFDEILKKVRRKRKSLLQISSNCSPPSGRQFYMDELSKYINITKYGKCANNVKCNQQCYDSEMDDHFFFLAFENAVCLDYLTEKFWNPLRHLTVPIILSREILNEFEAIPANSFIAASDFSSAEELAKFLNQILKDEAKYLSYFQWTKTYRKSLTLPPKYSAICHLCEMAHQKLLPGTKIIENISEYWQPSQHCVNNYGKFLANENGQNEKDVEIVNHFKAKSEVEIIHRVEYMEDVDYTFYFVFFLLSLIILIYFLHFLYFKHL